MNAPPSAGIYAVALHLPAERRTNDWWPAWFTASWLESRPDSRSLPNGVRETPGAIAALNAIKRGDDDPFMGVVERRVAPDDVMPSVLETHAARSAVDKAGLEPSELDFVITQSTQSDFVQAPNACVVHGELGLSQSALALSIDSGCNGYHHQLCLARALIGSGSARYGLLVQSNTLRRQCRIDNPFSAWFGDGAAAQVVGPVREGYGVLADAHLTEPAVTVRVGVPGHGWDAEARTEFYVADRGNAMRLLLSIPDWARDSIARALQRAGLTHKDVSFYASHQGTGWLRSVTQEYSGLSNARYLDTFAWTASLAAANIPAQLATAGSEGLIGEGDVVVSFGGGTGSTSTAMVYRWGGRT